MCNQWRGGVPFSKSIHTLTRALSTGSPADLVAGLEPPGPGPELQGRPVCCL
jgi:hypothetical protein